MGFQCAPKFFICSYIFIYNFFNVENFKSFFFFFFLKKAILWKKNVDFIRMCSTIFVLRWKLQNKITIWHWNVELAMVLYNVNWQKPRFPHTPPLPPPHPILGSSAFGFFSKIRNFSWIYTRKRSKELCGGGGEGHRTRPYRAQGPPKSIQNKHLVQSTDPEKLFQEQTANSTPSICNRKWCF